MRVSVVVYDTIVKGLSLKGGAGEGGQERLPATRVTLDLRGQQAFHLLSELIKEAGAYPVEA